MWPGNGDTSRAPIQSDTPGGSTGTKSAVYDCLVGVYCEERVHESGGAVHGVRLRADGPVPRHAGGRGGAAAMRPLAKLL